MFGGSDGRVYDFTWITGVLDFDGRLLWAFRYGTSRHTRYRDFTIATSCGLESKDWMRCVSFSVLETPRDMQETDEHH